MFPRKGARCSPRKLDAVRDRRMNELQHTNRPIGFQPCPLPFVFPEEATSEELARDENEENQVYNELEQAKKAHFLLGSRVIFLRTNFFSSGKFFITLVRSLEPCLMLLF
jgi:hypothetical protein